MLPGVYALASIPLFIPEIMGQRTCSIALLPTLIIVISMTLLAIDRGIAFTVVIHRDLPRRPGPGPAMATAEDGKKGVTRHGSAVLAALTQPRTMTELTRETGLTEGQLRFALRRLPGSGQVAMRGARGIEATRDERTTN